MAFQIRMFEKLIQFIQGVKNFWYGSDFPELGVEIMVNIVVRHLESPSLAGCVS